MSAASGAFDETRAELSAAVRDVRAAWSWTTTLWLLAFLAALVAPAVLPLSGRMPALAEFVYLALAVIAPRAPGLGLAAARDQRRAAAGLGVRVAH